MHRTDDQRGLVSVYAWLAQIVHWAQKVELIIEKKSRDAIAQDPDEQHYLILYSEAVGEAARRAVDLDAEFELVSGLPLAAAIRWSQSLVFYYDAPDPQALLDGVMEKVLPLGRGARQLINQQE